MRPILACLPAIALLTTGCDLLGGGSKSSASPQDQNATGQAAVQILAPGDQAAANTSVQAIQNMPTQVGGRLDPATRADLVSANATFRTDLQSNPSNSAASFGLAVTSLALRMDAFSDTLNTLSNSGLGVGSVSARMFQATPTQVVTTQAYAGRALSQPENVATIHGIQATFEANFLPTVDSVVSLLQTCWKDPNFSYRFQVNGFSDKDSLTIGRGDVGLALASVKAVRDYMVWLLSQDYEVGVSGQNFPTDYAWLDTLGNIDDSLGPKGTFQTLAFQNLQTLAPTGSFYSVKSGDLQRVQAIPADLEASAKLAKEAALYAHQVQTDFQHGLVQLNQKELTSFDNAMDSAALYLSGPHTFVRTPYTVDNSDYSNCIGTSGYVDTGSGSPVYRYTPPDYNTCVVTTHVRYPGYSVTVDVAKLITMADHKVFLPNFQWNTVADWAAKGPFNLLSGSTVTTYRQLKAMQNIHSPLDLNGILSWKDPTFSGSFPTFRNSLDVLTKLDSLNEKPIAAGRVAGRLIPRAVGF